MCPADPGVCTSSHRLLSLECQQVVKDGLNFFLCEIAVVKVTLTWFLLPSGALYVGKNTLLNMKILLNWRRFMLTASAVCLDYEVYVMTVILADRVHIHLGHNYHYHLRPFAWNKSTYGRWWSLLYFVRKEPNVYNSFCFLYKLPLKVSYLCAW